jgi:hypothetical protein
LEAAESSEKLIPSITEYHGVTFQNAVMLIITAMTTLNLAKFNMFKVIYIYIMWNVDPLLGKDSDISNYTTAVAK